MRLTENERQLLLSQLSEITAELDEIRTKVTTIAARIERSPSTSPVVDRGRMQGINARDSAA